MRDCRGVHAAKIGASLVKSCHADADLAVQIGDKQVSFNALSASMNWLSEN